MAVHNCKYCKTECGFGGENKKRDCVVYTPMTNADRIRAMSDEELAAFFVERDMILLRKALSVFEAESLIPENAQDELLKDMLAALQQPAEEG